MKLLRTALAVLALAVAGAAHAQILTGAGPVVYGHHHFNTADLAAQKRFFVEILGGTTRRAGWSGDRGFDIVEFPGVQLWFRTRPAPVGGSIGTTVNHVGFSVPDLKTLVPRIKAAGFKLITTESVAATVKVTDDIAAASPTTNIAFILAPDDLKVELVEVKSQPEKVKLHHVHFFGEKNTEMQAWYVKTFGAKPLPPNPAAVFVQAQLPGVSLNFSPSSTPTAGTPGRALDHIGFEIKNLEAFTQQLEAQGIKFDRPYTKVPALGIAIAFLKDPWGTNIELTEGLAEVK